MRLDFPANVSRLSFAAVLAGGAAMLGGVAMANGTTQSSNITVTVTNMRSTEGVVRACITTDPNEFPKCDDKATSMNMVTPADQNVKFTFKNVPTGRYAIALLHDENNNGKADRALFMMPTEGFGFSRDAKVRMGPPKFEAAAFDVAGKPITQTIKMRYML
jgi:uncharacterized protein (DUF2141 family)